LLTISPAATVYFQPNPVIDGRSMARELPQNRRTWEGGSSVRSYFSI
jgi:hypothetical protein